MHEQNHPPQNLQQSGGSVWLGLGLTLSLHLLQVPIGIVFAALTGNPFHFLIPPMFFGITQLVYIVPTLIIAHNSNEPHIVKGLLIGASISFLLNAACTGLVFFKGLQ